MHNLDSSYGFALEEKSEELLALQLAEMEEMGFMKCEENLRALLKSGADVEQAVKRLLEKTYPEEGQWTSFSRVALNLMSYLFFFFFLIHHLMTSFGRK